MMIIDAHNHPDWRGHDFAKFMKNMDEFKIDVTWLLSWESPDDEYDPHANHVVSEVSEHGPIPFARCLKYKQLAPERFVIGHAPDPRRPEAIDQMSALVDIYGVKIYGEFKYRMMMDNPDAIRMFHFCSEKNLPVVFHIDYELPRSTRYPRPNYWYGGDHDALERALQLCPETIFLGHAPGFWARISGDDQYLTISYPKGKVQPGGAVVELLRKYPNLYCDLSGGSGHNALNRDHEHAKEFVLESLKSGKIKRAALDVFHDEPDGLNWDLVRTKNLISTPHVGGSTHEAWRRISLSAADNIVSFFQGVPKNILKP